MSRIAVYAGSFNPLTNGHLDIIYKASTVFDKLYVVIAQNANKPNSHTSVEAIKADLKSYTVCNTEVVELPPNLMLVELAERLNATFLVRGLRGSKDFDSEFEMADINSDLSRDNIETIFFISDPIYRSTSSSLVRSLVGLNGWEETLEGYVPEHALEEFIKRNKK